MSPAHPGEAAGHGAQAWRPRSHAPRPAGLRPSSEAPSRPAETRFHRATHRASLPPPLSHLLRGGEARPRTSAQGQRAKAVSDDLSPALPVSMLCRARPGSRPWLHPLPLPSSRPRLHCGPAREKHEQGRGTREGGRRTDSRGRRLGRALGSSSAAPVYERRKCNRERIARIFLSGRFMASFFAVETPGMNNVTEAGTAE